MWSECKHEPTELGYDPDRKVKLSIGQLVEALAEALYAVEDAPAETKWKKGDHAFVEVEVTGTCNGHANLVARLPSGKRRSFSLPQSSLQEIA